MIRRLIRFSAENKFLVLGAGFIALLLSFWAMRTIPLDALPDLSDTQVIVYSKWDRSPDQVEDQVTYPIVTSLLGAPKVKAVRGLSDFGFSYVYVIFEDGTDIYWARSRVLEYLSKITASLPQGVRTELGPDATAVGWVYQYALVDRSGKHPTDELRSTQDWFMRYALQSVPGVAEVATVGGQARQFQVSLDPNAMAAHRVTIDKVIAAVKAANSEGGGRLVEISGREYMVRGRGYARTLQDFGSAVLKTEGGTPVRLSDVATISLGPEMRRGLTDLDGHGDAVGGIVIMRQGENALGVIHRVKDRIAELKHSLPPGVEVVTVYDRSTLIERAIETVKDKLVEEMIIVSIVILIFLWHVPSAIVPIVTIPLSVALAFIPMLLLGQNANLMSLAGIAISIGVLVDGAIVEVENAYKKLEHWVSGGRIGDFHKVRLEALLEVGPSVFFSLLVIAIAFMPVFTLVDQEGRLFRPLAYSKNLAMAIAAILAVTVDPAMRMLFARMDPFFFKPRWLARAATTALVGTYYPEEKHPVSRFLHRIYEPPCRFVLRHAKATLAVALLMVLATVPVFLKLGSEFMPRLGEGTLLYMPSTLPGLSETEAQRILQIQDRLIRTVPEVDRVFGKAGRHGHGPRALFHDGDGHPAQARGPVAGTSAVVLVLGPQMGQGDPALLLAGPGHRGGHRGRSGQGRAPSGHSQRLDHAHQGPHRHALHRHPHPRGPQGQRRGPEGHPAHRRGGRGHPAEGPRHPQRPGRTHRRRLLPGLRAQTGAAGPLRPQRGGGQHAGHDRRGRRQPDHGLRRPGPLPRERPLRPGLP